MLSAGAGRGTSNQDEDGSFLNLLGSLGLRGVECERERIYNERESVSAGTRALAFDNYQTFIAAAGCGRDVAKQLCSARQLLRSGLSDKLPELRRACKDFERQANELSMKRRNASLVLARHTRLLEVLELPQLAETCVRNGHYEEALELRQYVTRLDKKLGGISIVSQVVRSVQAACNAMLLQLINLLKAPITLPQCLKVVGYLRRMDVFAETELRLCFLLARDSWMTNALASVAHDASHDRLTKVMELTRVSLFDIVTQYRALFSDDDPVRSVTALSSDAANRHLFATWLNRKIEQFLNSLRRDLARGGTHQPPLDAVIGQAMYFGQSFGRVGADFRLSLVPIFTEAIKEACFGHLASAESNFSTGIDELALKASIAPSARDLAVPTDPHQPPAVLLDFLPLAELCNAILSSLNELRALAPLELAPQFLARLQSLLQNCGEALSERHKRFGKSSTDTEKAAFQRLVTCFSHDLLTFIHSCIGLIYPESEVKLSLDLWSIRKKLPLPQNPMPPAGVIRPASPDVLVDPSLPIVQQASDTVDG